MARINMKNINNTSHGSVSNVAGVAFGDYEEQQKLQRNTSMVVLRSLGYGKKSIENKILEEADHLVASFKVSFIHLFKFCESVRGIKVSKLNLAQKSTMFLVQEQFVTVVTVFPVIHKAGNVIIFVLLT